MASSPDFVTRLDELVERVAAADKRVADCSAAVLDAALDQDKAKAAASAARGALDAHIAERISSRRSGRT